MDGVVLPRWLSWWRPPCLLRLVIVNLTSNDEEALRGVLWSSRGPWLTLKDVTMLKANNPPIPMDGAVIVHRSNVAFIQVLP